MKKYALLILMLFIASGAGAVPPEQPLPDPGQEARAVALGNEIRCVVCQSESIEESEAGMARDLRKLIREKIAEGWSDRQIEDYLRARYGDFILLRPPFQANTWFLWLGPALFTVIAFFCFQHFFRRSTGRRRA